MIGPVRSLGRCAEILMIAHGCRDRPRGPSASREQQHLSDDRDHTGRSRVRRRQRTVRAGAPESARPPGYDGGTAIPRTSSEVIGMGDDESVPTPAESELTGTLKTVAETETAYCRLCDEPVISDADDFGEVLEALAEHGIKTTTCPKTSRGRTTCSPRCVRAMSELQLRDKTITHDRRANSSTTCPRRGCSMGWSEPGRTSLTTEDGRPSTWPSSMMAATRAGCSPRPTVSRLASSCSRSTWRCSD